MIVCVVKFRLSEKEPYRKGILIESLNPYTDITEQIIIDGSCHPVGIIHDFIRL